MKYILLILQIIILLLLLFFSYKYGRYRERIIDVHRTKGILPMKNALLSRWLQNRNEGLMIGNILKQRGAHNVAIYGSAILGQLLFGELKNSGVETLCFIDQKADDVKSEYCRIPLMKMSDYVKRDTADLIIITPLKDGGNIENILVDNGIDRKKIIHISSLVWGTNSLVEVG